jgi:dUTPase
MKIQVKQVDKLNVPSREPDHDSSGYDLIATEEPRILGKSVDTEMSVDDKPLVSWYRVDWIEYHTNLFIAPQSDDYGNKYHTLLMPRSSLRKYNLSLCNSVGLIDVDYRGELILCFNYIWQPEDLFQYNNSLVGRVNMDRIYKKGDAIGQIVAEVKNEIDWVVVGELSQTVRGEDGFGSRDEKIKIQSTQSPVEGHKTSTSPLIDLYKKLSPDIFSEEPRPSYEKIVKEREKQLPT